MEVDLKERLTFMQLSLLCINAGHEEVFHILGYIAWLLTTSENALQATVQVRQCWVIQAP